jgi:type I restriction enzyme S subunit
MTARLDEVCNVELGTRVVKKRDGGRTYPVYGGGGATFLMDEYNRQDCLVISRFGMSEECTRFVAGKFFLNDSGLTVSPKDESLAQRFLEYQMKFLSDAIFDLGRGTAQRNLDVPALRALPVFVPSVPEQQRIIRILDEAFEGIATAKAKAEKNLRLGRAMFESHIDSVFGHNDCGWPEKRLAELCTFSSGSTPSKANGSYWGGGIPWVSGRDMKSTRLWDSALHMSQSAVDETQSRLAPAGTLLVLVRGMGLAHGAQIAELMAPCAFNQDIRGIHLEPNLMPRYLLFALRSRVNSSDTALSRAAHGTLKIDSEELQNLSIPVPPPELQQRIVATVDSLVEETERLEAVYQRKLAALDALKQSLLHQAFTGQLGSEAA